MTAKVNRRQRLECAIDRLAGMLDCGHLLAATDPATMLDTVTAELRDLRRAVANWVAWREAYGGLGSRDRGRAV